MLSSALRFQESSHEDLLILLSHRAFRQSPSRQYVSSRLMNWKRTSRRSTVSAVYNSLFLQTAVWRICNKQRIQIQPWNTLLTTLEMHLWHTLRFVKVENSRRGMQAWIICFVPRISGSGGPESKVTLFFLQVVPLRISFHLSEFYPFSSKTTI